MTDDQPHRDDPEAEARERYNRERAERRKRIDRDDPEAEARERHNSAAERRKRAAQMLPGLSSWPPARTAPKWEPPAQLSLPLEYIVWHGDYPDGTFEEVAMWFTTDELEALGGLEGLEARGIPKDPRASE